MTRSTIERALSFSVSVAFAGCSVITNLDDLHKSIQPDAAPDAPVEASTIDASDASACADSGLPFCDGFDDRTAPQGAWSALSVAAGAALAIQTDHATSPPNALAVTAPATTTGDAQTYLQLAIPTATLTNGSLDVSFHAFVPFINSTLYGTNGDASVVFDVRWADQTNVFQLVSAHDGFEAHSATWAADAESDSVAPLAIQSSELLVVLHVVFDASGAGSVSLSTNSMPLVDLANVTTLPSSGAPSSSLLLRIGVLQHGQAPTFTMYFDDVLVH